jgi:hypothetical protein
MKILIAAIMLIFFGIIALKTSVICLNLAGLPGALLAGKPRKRKKW